MALPQLDTELLSLRELARRTSISKDEIRRWRDEENMPVYQSGKRRQAVIWSEFWEWMRSRKRHPGTPPPR